MSGNTTEIFNSKSVNLSISGPKKFPEDNCESKRKQTETVRRLPHESSSLRKNQRKSQNLRIKK